MGSPDRFSERVIAKMVSNAMGEDFVLEEEDYSCIIEVFRQLGGSWEKVLGGEDGTVALLNKVVTKWLALSPDAKTADN